MTVVQLLHQYRDDMRFPVTDADSRQRRIEAIEAVLATFAALDPPYQTTERAILDAMATYGGSFVKGLARLYLLGDPDNRQKLASTFTEYFHKYDAMAAVRS